MEGFSVTRCVNYQGWELCRPMEFLSLGRLLPLAGFLTLKGFLPLRSFLTLMGFPPLMGFLPLRKFSASGVSTIGGISRGGKALLQLVVFYLNETNQEKGYKYAMFGRCHSFRNSSNLTCKGYTVTGEGLVELTS